MASWFRRIWPDICRSFFVISSSAFSQATTFLTEDMQSESQTGVLIIICRCKESASLCRCQGDRCILVHAALRKGKVVADVSAGEPKTRMYLVLGTCTAILRP